MNKEMFVSSTPRETRLAISEDGDIAEVYYEREQEYSLVGSIYKGRVTRVLPGMQSAFVDIGLERDAFLYVSDFFEDSEEYDRVVTSAEEAVLKNAEPEAQPPEAVAVPAGVGESTALASIPAVPARGERERPRDWERGRRARHRRQGPGFPSDKFASERAARSGEAARTVPALPIPASVEAATAPMPVPATALVLPGEKLAKYASTTASEPAAREVPPAPDASVPALGSDSTHPMADPQSSHVASATEIVSAVEKVQQQRPATGEEFPEAWLALAPEHLNAPVHEDTASELDDFQAIGAGEPSAQEGGDLPADYASIDQASAALDSAAETAAEDDLDDASPVEDGAEVEITAAAQAGINAPAATAPLQNRSRRRRRGRGRRRGSENAAAAPVPAPAGANDQTAPAVSVARGERGPRQIGELLHEGQEILVQIAKEPLGRKGARITSHLALPGRYLVYMPTVSHIGVSRKIGSDDERARVKRLILDHMGDLPGGFIVRTAAQGATEEEFKADIRFLGNLWNDLRQQFESSRAPSLLYHDLNLVERTLRDQLSTQFTHIWVDSEEHYQRTVRFVSHFMPALASRVRLYTRDTPMFEHFRVQEEIDKALKSKVWLKSGGYIVINQTEALVAIDINTGKFVGRSNRLEDTIVKTNVDAVREIVRQIRLRDLGGIIVIDFIDMDERRNRQKVMLTLEEAMRVDRAPFKILSLNDFGLVALTRKRVKQSLERALGSPCSYCGGSGLVKSAVTVCNEIFSEARKMAGQIDRADLMLRVNPEVAKLLKAKNAMYLNDIEEATGKTVLVRADPQVHQEQFEIS